jgi:hypothetical protein
MRGGADPSREASDVAVAEPPIGAGWFAPSRGALFEAGPAWFRSPILACYLNPGWREARLASVLVVRGGGGMAYAHAYLVDLLGEGLQDCYPVAAMSLREFDRKILKAFESRLGGVDTCEPIEAAKLVAAGMRISRERGFSTPSCVDRCVRGAGDPPPDSELDLTLFEPAAPSPTQALPTLQAERKPGGTTRLYRVIEADPERRPTARIRDLRAFAAHYGGNLERFRRPESGRLLMPLYTAEDLEEGRLRSRGIGEIACNCRATYAHCDADDVLNGLIDWMDLKFEGETEDRMELAWKREHPTRRAPFSLLRLRQQIGRISLSPMKITLQADSRALLYAGRIWIENALPGLQPLEFSYGGLEAGRLR